MPTEPETEGNPNPIDSPIPDQIIESIAVGGVTSVGGQSAVLSNISFGNAAANVNLAQQNAVANQQAMNNLGLSVVGGAVNLVADLNPLEAMSAEQVLTGNVVAQELVAIQGALKDLSGITGRPGSPPTKQKNLPVIRRGKSGLYKLYIRKDQMPFETIIYGPNEPVKSASGETEGFK